MHYNNICVSCFRPTHLLELPEQPLLGVLLDRVPDLVRRDFELLARASRDLAHEVEVTRGLLALIANVQRDVVPHRDHLLAACPKVAKRDELRAEYAESGVLLGG